MPRASLLASLVVLALPAAGAAAAGKAPKPASPAAPDVAAVLTNANYTRGCGPVDQPVTLVYLTGEVFLGGVPRAPYVQVWFAGGLDTQGRYSGGWDAPQRDIGATWCRAASDCVPVARGRIEVRHSPDDGTLNGEIQLDLDGIVGGPLRATPLPTEHTSCG